MTDPDPLTKPDPGSSDAASRAFGLKIGRDGTWYYRGSPITRAPLVRLFASVLRREGEEFWLITPAERGRIEVEDAPFVAVESAVDGAGRDRRIRFRTNVDDWVTAGPGHPLRVAVDPGTGEPRPYILVRDGLEARILRPVYYDLADLAEPADDGSGGLGIWSEGQFFRLA